MSNKIFKVILGIVFVAVCVGLCSVAVREVAEGNPFAVVIALGFAAIFGVTGADLIRRE